MEELLSHLCPCGKLAHVYKVKVSVGLVWYLYLSDYPRLPPGNTAVADAEPLGKLFLGHTLFPAQLPQKDTEFLLIQSKSLLFCPYHKANGFRITGHRAGIPKNLPALSVSRNRTQKIPPPTASDRQGRDTCFRLSYSSILPNMAKSSPSWMRSTGAGAWGRALGSRGVSANSRPGT